MKVFRGKLQRVRPSPRRGKMFGLALVLLAQGVEVRAATFDDADWPCIQRKVEGLTLGQMWGHPPPEGDWRADPRIGELVGLLAPRRTPIEMVEAQAQDFTADLAEDARAEKIAQLFAGILSVLDGERGEIVGGIARYAQKQTGLAARVEAQQTELVAAKAAADPDLDTIEALTDRLAWDVRVFRERAQSLTYVCEAPVLIEQRAFAIGRILAELV